MSDTLSKKFRLGASHSDRTFSTFAKSYYKTAHRLATNLRKRKFHENSEIYPILFLYRHSIELYLKSIIKTAELAISMTGENIDSGFNIYKCHNLEKLMARVSSILTKIDSPLKSRKHLSVQELINQLHVIDNGSYAFRYPLTTTGQPSIDKALTIDLQSIFDLIEPTMDYLINKDILIDQWWTAIVQAHTEAEKEGNEGLWPQITFSIYGSYSR